MEYRKTRKKMEIQRGFFPLYVFLPLVHFQLPFCSLRMDVYQALQLFRWPSCQRTLRWVEMPRDASKPMVFLLHGLLSGPDQFRGLGQHLAAEGYYVVSLKYTSCCVFNPTIQDYVQTVLDEIDEEWDGGAHWVIGGTSFGGVVARVVAETCGVPWFSLGAPHMGGARPRWFHSLFGIAAPALYRQLVDGHWLPFSRASVNSPSYGGPIHPPPRLVVADGLINPPPRLVVADVKDPLVPLRSATLGMGKLGGMRFWKNVGVQRAYEGLPLHIPSDMHHTWFAYTYYNSHTQMIRDEHVWRVVGSWLEHIDPRPLHVGTQFPLPKPKDKKGIVIEIEPQDSSLQNKAW
jgi:hypothetical protein